MRGSIMRGLRVVRCGYRMRSRCVVRGRRVVHGSIMRGRSIVRCRGVMRGSSGMRFAAQGLVYGQVLRMPAIVSGIRTLVAAGGILVLRLEGGSARVLIVLGQPLLGGGFVVDAAGSSAEGDVAVPFNKAPIHAFPINESNAAVKADVHDGSVVGKDATAPLAAGKAEAAVAKAVVHAAVVADVPSPVALMEEVPAVIPTPIRRRP